MQKIIQQSLLVLALITTSASMCGIKQRISQALHRTNPRPRATLSSHTEHPFPELSADHTPFAPCTEEGLKETFLLVQAFLTRNEDEMRRIITEHMSDIREGYKEALIEGKDFREENFQAAIQAIMQNKVTAKLNRVIPGNSSGVLPTDQRLIDLAIRYGDGQFVQLLLDNGADPSLAQKKGGAKSTEQENRNRAIVEDFLGVWELIEGFREEEGE